MKVFGMKKGNSKDWLTKHTWKAIDERQEIKNKILNTKSARLKNQLNAAYKAKDKEVKKSARRDKRTHHLEEKANQVEQAAHRRDLNRVYKITNELCNANSHQNMPIKDKDGNTITSEKRQAERWVQHFTEVLNRPAPKNPAHPQESTWTSIQIHLPRRKS